MMNASFIAPAATGQRHDRTIAAGSVVTAVAVLICIGFATPRASAQDHPQEVLDLVSTYQALGMKVRPLQDRVVIPANNDAGFRPEGVPLRAGTSATTTSGPAAEQRIPETLRHRNRSTSAADVDAIRCRLATLDGEIQSEIRRISAPGFASSPARAVNRAGASNRVDPSAIATSRRKLAELEREYAAIEREIAELGDD